MNGAGYLASPAALGIAPCRSKPHWCPLPAADAADAPIQIHGSVPCVLPLRCPGFQTGFRFHPAPPPDGDGASTPGQQRTLECLRDKVIVFLGDSVMRELFTEWALWLGTSVPGFNARWLTNDFKKQVQDAAEPTTRHSIGPLDVLFKLYNQDVSLTDHRLNLTIKFRTATHFNWTSGESTAGLRYWQSADFRQELEKLGVHPMAHPHGVDAVFASTTFHDDTHLVTDCAPRHEGCQCNTSWSDKLARYASDAAAVASNLTTLQRAGVQVV